MSRKIGRLTRRAEFLFVARSRRRWATPGLVLQAARRPAPAKSVAGNGPRVGFTASKKVGNAVARNRVKRRLRALADECLPDRAQAGYDYVLIGRRATVERPFPALQNDLLTALKRVHKPSAGKAPTGPAPGTR